jgi:hypothetical protein
MPGAGTRVRRLPRWRSSSRPPAPTSDPAGAVEKGRRLGWHHAVLGVILAVAVVLRLWSINHGLPYIYNTDEQQHFVFVAAQMVSHHTLNPHYFVNPPGLSYLLGAFFTVGWINGHPGQAFSNDPEPFFLLARIVVAAIGVASVYFVYLLGRRYDSARTGLVAAAILAVSFIDVWYSKQALDDAVAPAPMILAALFALRGFDEGRRRDFIIAGLFAGVAAATKYTSGAILFSVVAAALLASREGGWRSHVKLLLSVFGSAAVGFLILNPFSVLDVHTFLTDLVNQSSGANSNKVGAPPVAPWRYYLWSFTWGIGWAATVAAVGGIVIALREQWRRFVILATGPAVGLGFLALYERAFARYALPVYPVIAVLAALAAVRLAAWLPVSNRLRTAALTVFAVVLAAEGAIATVHLDQKLGKQDTREAARQWLVSHVPAGTRVAVEPFWPAGMLEGSTAQKLYTVLQPIGGVTRFLLMPSYIDDFRTTGTCWVVAQNTWQDRALDFNAPKAKAFYQRLVDESDVHKIFSPWAPGKTVNLNFDWSFDYYPDAYVRPGSYVEIFHLRDCTPSTEPTLQDELWQ